MINEETLTFYYYEDGLTASERLEVETALGEDAELAARYSRLRRHLEQLRQLDTHPAPSHLVQHWHDSIDKAAAMDNVATNRVSKPPLHFLSFAWGAVAMAAMALGIGIAVYFSTDMPGFDGDESTELLVNQPVRRDPASFERGLKLHLQESHSYIVSLPAEAATNRISLLMQIIEQNRMFERAAKRNNSPKLARVLRAFEPVLMELAAEDLTPIEAEALRSQLAFEFDVMLTKLVRDTSNDARSNSI